MIRAPDISEMDEVRALFREYQQWLGVDLCFQGFEQELSELPGRYAEPLGGILVAEDEAGLFGCVAFRPRDDSEAELKRLYVRPAQQGHGVGKALFVQAMSVIRSRGYRSVVLDTLQGMRVAQGLYLDYGFQEIKPYYANPEEGAMYFRYDFNT